MTMIKCPYCNGSGEDSVQLGVCTLVSKCPLCKGRRKISLLDWFRYNRKGYGSCKRENQE